MLGLLIVATVILGLIPGPNVLLIVAVALRDGVRAGLLTVLGTTIGLAVQLLVLALGVALLVDLVAGGLFYLKWVGVGYLVFLGLRALREADWRWRRPGGGLPDEAGGEAAAPVTPGKRAVLTGAFIAFANPKTFLFIAALLPQFVVADAGFAVEIQMFTVSAVYLLTLAMVDCGWVLFARGAARLFGDRRWGRRGTSFIEGLVLLAAAGLLAATRR